MKRSLRLLLVLCMMLMGAQVANAALLPGGTGVSDAKVYDADALMNVKTLAIADSIYYGPTVQGEPEIDDLPEILMNATVTGDKKGVLTYVSYREVCQNIKVAKRVDILRLDHRKAFNEYKANIALYADAYMVTTVSNGTSVNDGTRLNIFYDVYDAKTNQIIYSYRKLAPKSAERDAALYTGMTEDFFSDFIKAQETAREEKEKEEKAILKLQKEEAKQAAKDAEKAAED